MVAFDTEARTLKLRGGLVVVACLFNRLEYSVFLRIAHDIRAALTASSK